MKYLPLSLFCVLLLTCTSVPPENRLDITLYNATGEPIVIRAKMGFFGRKLELNPGEMWEGWVLRNLAGGEIQIQVEPGEEEDE